MKPGFGETAQSAKCEGLGFIPRKGAGCDVTVLGDRYSKVLRSGDGQISGAPWPVTQAHSVS